MLVAVQELHWKNKNTSNAAQCDNHRAIARNDARHGPSPLLVSTPPSAEIADAALLPNLVAKWDSIWPWNPGGSCVPRREALSASAYSFSRSPRVQVPG
jgi:hypothetical protein